MEENILHWSILQKPASFGFRVLSRDFICVSTEKQLQTAAGTDITKIVF